MDEELRARLQKAERTGVVERQQDNSVLTKDGGWEGNLPSVSRNWGYEPPMKPSTRLDAAEKKSGARVPILLLAERED